MPGPLSGPGPANQIRGDRRSGGCAGGAARDRECLGLEGYRAVEPWRFSVILVFSPKAVDTNRNRFECACSSGNAGAAADKVGAGLYHALLLSGFDLRVNGECQDGVRGLFTGREIAASVSEVPETL